MTDATTKGSPETRTLTVEREVDATPEAVWDAITTGEGLKQWFPLDARVEPGEGGSVWLSWGPGMEAQAPITLWDAPKRFQWTESHGEDPSGRPIKIAVDFHVEGREGGSTVVRVVQSGLSAGSEWDEMYDALKDGWTYFLFNLAFYLARHAGKERKMAWQRAATELAREAVWERLLTASLVAGASTVGGDAQIVLDEARPARVESAREGYHFAATLPDLDDAVLFVELEGRHVGVWLSTYGVDDPRVQELQTALDQRVEAALGV